jgi:hypothetical protein
MRSELVFLILYLPTDITTEGNYMNRTALLNQLNKRRLDYRLQSKF